MESYRLPGELRDALMAYLRTQPYGSVAEGMKALEDLKVLDDAPKTEMRAVEAG